jgi:hypothetical protein
MAYKRTLIWKQKEASRGIRAVKAEGLTVVRLEISPDGKISIVTAEPEKKDADEIIARLK